MVFDDDNAVANGGLCLPMTLAQHLGLRELIDTHVDLGAVAGRANPGLKTMGLIASALAGGDSIDDAEVLRCGRSEEAIGQWMPAPSTLGTFLRGFSWAHARQLDTVASELLARAWGAGAGPGSSALTIDVDSTICQGYGRKKQRRALATPRCGATTTCWPPRRAPATCWVCGPGAATPTPPGERRGF